MVKSTLRKATAQPSWADVRSDTVILERIDVQERLGRREGAEDMWRGSTTSCDDECAGDWVDRVLGVVVETAIGSIITVVLAMTGKVGGKLYGMNDKTRSLHDNELRQRRH
jgi:hypothetical protein